MHERNEDFLQHREIAIADLYLGVAFDRRLVGYHLFIFLLFDLDILIINFPQQTVQLLLIFPISIKNEHNCCDDEQQCACDASHNFASMSCKQVLISIVKKNFYTAFKYHIKLFFENIINMLL